MVQGSRTREHACTGKPWEAEPGRECSECSSEALDSRTSFIPDLQWRRAPPFSSMHHVAGVLTHAQGRRWAGVMKERMSKKGRPFDISTFDAGATFRSYGVGFADREGRHVRSSPCQLPAGTTP